jgi:hypothetical protein
MKRCAVAILFLTSLCWGWQAVPGSPVAARGDEKIITVPSGSDLQRAADAACAAKLGEGYLAVGVNQNAPLGVACRSIAPWYERAGLIAVGCIIGSWMTLLAYVYTRYCFEIHELGKMSDCPWARCWAWRLHQYWLNFLGFLVGCVASAVLIIDYSRNGGLVNLGLLIVAFAGLTGKLPHLIIFKGWKT